MLETWSKQLGFLQLRLLRLNLSKRATGSSSYAVQASRYLQNPTKLVSIYIALSHFLFSLPIGCCWYQESFPGLHSCWRWKLFNTIILLWGRPVIIYHLAIVCVCVWYESKFELRILTNCCAVDCIDCAADTAVVSAVNDGIEAARGIVGLRRPWVMISVNDDDDLHFRKAGIYASFHWFNWYLVLSVSPNSEANVI